MPNGDTTRVVDTWLKFGLANAPWLLFPWFVLYWGRVTLDRLSGWGNRGADKGAFT